MNDQWTVLIPGYETQILSTDQVRAMISAKLVNANTPIRDASGQATYPAGSIPGLFSDKEYLTAVLISLFAGGLGIDRFYLGYTTEGILKLITFGGCGVWAIIDLILIATRSLKDSNGLPLK